MKKPIMNEKYISEVLRQHGLFRKSTTYQVKQLAAEFSMLALFEKEVIEFGSTITQPDGKQRTNPAVAHYQAASRNITQQLKAMGLTLDQLNGPKKAGTDLIKFEL